MRKLLVWFGVIVGIFVSAGTFVSCKKTQEATTRYEITAEYVPENTTLTGTVKVTFENSTDNEISTLKFQLYPNAYRKDAKIKPISKTYENIAYYAGESYGEMVISSVAGAKNWEVLGEDENVLYAHLPRSLFPGESVVLDIGFLVKLAAVEHRTGVAEHAVNLGNFYPVLCGIKNGGFCEEVYGEIGDPFYQEVADFSLTLTVPKEYVVAATGDVMRERSLERKKEYVFSATNVRDFAVVLSTQFQVLQAEAGGNTIRYYYYDDKNARATLDLAAEAFVYFEETFGEYPYLGYSVVQTGFCYGGMEYPRLAFISDDLTGEEKTRAVVHETAHQWWNVVVGSDQIENAWQDEGLAEYSALAFFEEYPKYGITREGAVREALKEYRSYYDVYGSVLGRSDTKMTRTLTAYVSEYEYKCLAYDKAVVMLDTLRKAVGDGKFFDGLRRYYKENAFLMAQPAHLIGSFEKVGLDVNGFFESFLFGKAIL